MKTTIDIPDDLLKEVMEYSNERSKKGAIITAMSDYVSRKKMARLKHHLGQYEGFLTVKELIDQRK